MRSDWEDAGFTQETAEAAVALMKRHGVPPTPENYAVWYTYCAEANRELTVELNHLIAAQAPFTPQRNAEIYDRFFGHGEDGQVIETAGERLEAVIDQVLTLLGQAGRDTKDHGRRLAHLSGELADGDSVEHVQATMRKLLTEIRGVLAKNKRLEDRLSKSSAAISELRADLETVRRDAMTDGLTGIANRKKFNQCLQQAASDAEEGGTPLSLVLMDIDHFKAFNDRYGHQIGDEVLKLVAQALEQQIKGRDTAARYGGEEFALVLPETRLTDAVTVADGIRHRLASGKLTNKKGEGDFGKVTVSAGAAQYRAGESLDDLLRRADRALYAAKSAGRNCVCSESAADTAEQSPDSNVTPLRRPAG